MASAITTSLVGAFEAALSVLLTLLYGVLAARAGLVKPATARDVSHLCVRMFLPALLMVNVGAQLHLGSIRNYVPVFLWALAYVLVSIALGVLGVKLLKLPPWVAPACAFNNTTSLPLLLTTSLATTGILASIAGEDVGAAVERAKSYFLINSCVSNALTFALGPKLLSALASKAPPTDSEEEEEEAEQREDAREGEAAAEEEGASECSALLPKPVAARADRAGQWSRARFSRLPRGLRHAAELGWSMVNAPLVGALLAILFGLVPPLHRALFAETTAGGWARAWLTSSVANIGDLFTALQMFVVGSKLNESFSAAEASVSWRALAYVAFVRFVLWSVVSLGVVYALARKTAALGPDPMVWWTMCLMPVGPPAMILSSMCEEAQARKRQKMGVARMLVWAYAVTPVVFLPVVAALKVCEMVLADREK